MRLHFKQEEVMSASFARVHGVYKVEGTLRAFVNADYRTNYPKTLAQSFSVTVRFSPFRCWEPWNLRCKVRCVRAVQVDFVAIACGFADSMMIG